MSFPLSVNIPVAALWALYENPFLDIIIATFLKTALYKYFSVI